MSRFHISIVALLLALLGCATERPTRSEPVTELRSTPLSVVPVIESSPWTPAYGERREEQTIQFDSTSARTVDEDWDIAITCIVDAARPTSGLMALEATHSDWVEFEGALPTSKLVLCNGLGCITAVYRLTSQLPINGTYLTPAGALCVRALGAHDFRGRLVRYSSDYHFVTLRIEDVISPPALGITDAALYVFANFRDPRNLAYSDSILTFDLTGARRNGLVSSPVGSAQAFDGSAFWTAGDLLRRVDVSGRITDVLPGPPGAVAAMAWDQGTLWWMEYGYPFGPAQPVYAIDINASLQADSLIYEERFRFEPRRASCMTVDKYGPVIITPSVGAGSGARIYRYTRAGALRDSLISPVPAIDAVMCDGNDMWTLHHGTAEAPTDATLLSRFTLE